MGEGTNTAEYWDAVYAREGAGSWRNYPGTGEKIRDLLPPAQRIVELGGGPGILALSLQQDGHAVVMIDHSSRAVAQAKARGVNLAIVGRVPECLEAFQGDYVVACEFLEHFADPARILSAAAQVAPNAIYVVPNEVLGDHPEHAQEFSSRSLRELCARFYHRVEIYAITDEWRAKIKDGFLEREQPIAIPILIAHCRGVRE